jgi:hypothetical protein
MALTAAFIAAQNGGFEPQRQNNFSIEIYGVPGADTISLAVESTNFPADSNEQVLVSYQNSERKVAGKAKVGDKTIVCVDYVDQPVFKSLVAWRKLVYDSVTERVGLAKDYKKQAAYILTDPSGNQTRTCKYIGVWPKNLNPGQLNYSSSGVLKLTLTLAVDVVQFLV